MITTTRKSILLVVALGGALLACGKDIAGLDTHHLAGTWHINVDASVLPCYGSGYFAPIVLTVTQAGSVLGGTVDSAMVVCGDSTHHEMAPYLVLQGSTSGSTFTLNFIANSSSDIDAAFTAEATAPIHGTMAWSCLPLDGTCAGPTPSGNWTASKQ